MLFEDGLVVDESDFCFAVGEGEDLKCLDIVVPLMHPGEVAEIISDPEFAYGSLGFSGDGGGKILPANAAVTLRVSLVQILGEEEESMERRRTMGRRKKERGNFWYLREEHSQAIQCYRYSNLPLAFCSSINLKTFFNSYSVVGCFLYHNMSSHFRKATDWFEDPDLDLEAPVDRFSLAPDRQELLSERIKTFNNLAQSQMKIEAWDAALAAIGNVLKVEVFHAFIPCPYNKP